MFYCFLFLSENAENPPKSVLFWEPSAQSFHKYYFFVTSMVFSAEFLLISAAALSAVLVGDVIICSKK